MKKQWVLLVIAVLFSITAVQAQGGGGGQRMSPEERTKATMEKMEALKMDDATKAKVEVIITDFNNTSQKEMTAIREAGGDREEMMAKRKELSDARDAKLKEVLTQEQMKQWKDDIEPSMRPQRGGGQGGGGGK
ncbi:MAG: hypothetical protein IPL84_06505 [Chitinophagaceae bacterium]|nr:hypothetical protein [Chitinophagaceae bacterium]